MKTKQPENGNFPKISDHSYKQLTVYRKEMNLSMQYYCLCMQYSNILINNYSTMTIIWEGTKGNLR